jgi:hypothetical protein
VVGRSAEAVKDDLRLLGGRTNDLSQERKQNLGEVKSGVGSVARAAKNVVKRSATAVTDDIKVVGAIAKSVATGKDVSRKEVMSLSKERRKEIFG